MVTRNVAALAAMVAACASVWVVRGLILVAPTAAGPASILAAGARIYVHLWPALVAAGAATLAIAGAAAKRAAERETRAGLAADLAAAAQLRQQLDQERQMLQGQARYLDTIKNNCEAELRRAQAAINAERQGLTQKLEWQLKEILSLRGELAGSRQHIQRLRDRHKKPPEPKDKKPPEPKD